MGWAHAVCVCWSLSPSLPSHSLTLSSHRLTVTVGVTVAVAVVVAVWIYFIEAAGEQTNERTNDRTTRASRLAAQCELATKLFWSCLVVQGGVS